MQRTFQSQYSENQRPDLKKWVKYLFRHFTKDDMQKTNDKQAYEKCSTYVIRKLQI